MVNHVGECHSLLHHIVRVMLLCILLEFLIVKIDACSFLEWSRIDTGF